MLFHLLDWALLPAFLQPVCICVCVCVCVCVFKSLGAFSSIPLCFSPPR